MAKKNPNDYGTGIPRHEVEELVRILLPKIQRFFESEEGSGNLQSGKHSGTQSTVYASRSACRQCRNKCTESNTKTSHSGKIQDMCR